MNKLIMLGSAAEQFTHEWGHRNHTLTGAQEQALVEHVLTQLTDPPGPTMVHKDLFWLRLGGGHDYCN